MLQLKSFSDRFTKLAFPSTEMFIWLAGIRSHGESRRILLKGRVCMRGYSTVSGERGGCDARMDVNVS